MNQRRIVAAGLLALALAGCAGMGGETGRALAPTATLRVALLDAQAVHAIKDPVSGEMKGVGHDLGKVLAAQLGVSFEPVLYPTIARLLEAGRQAQWDVAFLGVTQERRAFLEFTAEHLQIEFGYLVPSDSKMSRSEEVDQPGRRVVVLEKGSPDVFLTGSLKRATLIRAAAIPGALELLKSGKADVLGGQKPNMYAVASRLPGSRVLDGRPGTEGVALALPKDRGPAALAYARRFIEEAKASGLVKQAIERAGLRGAVVAPRE